MAVKGSLSWGGIDHVARRLLLACMEGRGEMTSKQVGMAIHKHPSAAHQMLNALVMDDLVHMRRVNHLRGGVHFLWHRTEVPIPKEFTTTDRCTVHSPVETSSLTAKALTKAMGGGEPPLAKPNLIHRIR